MCNIFFYQVLSVKSRYTTTRAEESPEYPGKRVPEKCDKKTPKDFKRACTLCIYKRQEKSTKYRENIGILKNVELKQQ